MVGKSAAVAAALVAAAGTVMLCAAGAGASTTAPRIVAVAVSPQTIPRAGGALQVRVRVRAAARCTVESQHVASGPFALVRTVACSSGSAVVRVAVQPNPYPSAAAIHVRVRARGATGGTSIRTVAVRQAPAKTPPQPVEPLTVTSADLVAGTVGTAYEATLSATGGSPPYRWTLAGGALPAGLTLAAGGTIAGTPSAAGDAVVTVRVGDSAGATATAPLSITIAAPAPPPTSVTDYRSTNWSGYALLGGPYTAVTGTFDVPSIVAGGPVDTDASEWVGIDGTGPSNPGIIQAGVDESYSATTNKYGVFAWVELYPAPPLPVPLQVAPGNKVTVSMIETSTGIWDVSMKNLSTGQSWSAVEPYSGSATSAEWIVEAPTSARTLQVYPFAVISPVTFTALGVDPVLGALGRILMVQNGTTVATPSPLSANGFTVAYGSVTPAAP